MNGRFQMQGGKNWILPKEMNANQFFWDSHWLEIWSSHFCPSMGPNVVSVAVDLQKDPKGLSTFLVSAPSSCHTGYSNSCPPDLELGALIKWLASRCQSECLGRLLYIAPSSTAMGYCTWVQRSGVGQVSLPASESASDVPSCECYATLPWRQASESARQVSLPVMCQAVSVTQLDRLT